MAALLSPFALLMILVNAILTVHWYLMRRCLMSTQLQHFYQYGKTWQPVKNSDTSSGFAGLVYSIITTTAPKSYFRLFYIAAIAMNITCFMLPNYSLFPVQLMFGRGDIIASKHTRYLLIFTLEVLQVMRRCYECFVISVYSPSSRINMSHVVTGFVFYAGVALIIANYGFLDAGTEAPPVSFVTIAIGVTVFSAGFWLQLESHRTLAGLRRRVRPDGKKLIVTYDHMIPYGHLFEFVSNPHYFAELLIYAALLIISQFDFTFQLLCYYVLIAHCVMGEQSHRWYQEKFKDLYPNRKILIPGIY